MEHLAVSLLPHLTGRAREQSAAVRQPEQACVFDPHVNLLLHHPAACRCLCDPPVLARVLPHRPPVRCPPCCQQVRAEAGGSMLQLPRQGQGTRQRIINARDPRRLVEHRSVSLLPHLTGRAREQSAAVKQAEKACVFDPHFNLALHHPAACRCLCDPPVLARVLPHRPPVRCPPCCQ